MRKRNRKRKPVRLGVHRIIGDVLRELAPVSLPPPKLPLVSSVRGLYVALVRAGLCRPIEPHGVTFGAMAGRIVGFFP